MDATVPRLEIGLPSRNLELAYASGAATMLAGIVAGPGALILLSLLLWNAIRRNARAGGSYPRP